MGGRSKVLITPALGLFPTHFKYPLPKVKISSVVSHIVATIIRAVDAYEMLTLMANKSFRINKN